MCIAKESMSVVIPIILICDFHAARGLLSILSAFHRKELRNLTNASKSRKESGRRLVGLGTTHLCEPRGQGSEDFPFVQVVEPMMFQAFFVRCLRISERLQQDVVSERRGVDYERIFEFFGEVVYALPEGPPTWSIGARASTLIGRLKK